MKRDELRERMSRWAAGITAGFLVVLWPAIFVAARAWSCSGRCLVLHGQEFVLDAVLALMIVPVAALVFMLARRFAGAAAVVTAMSAGLLLLGAMGLWARSAGGLLADVAGFTTAADSFVLALVMAVYCAAVAGGSWMAAIGVRKLEGEE